MTAREDGLAVCWRLPDGPARDAIAAGAGWTFSACEEIARRPPELPLEPFRDGMWRRAPGALRTAQRRGEAGDAGVLVVKGLEPRSPVFHTLLDHLRKPTYSGHPADEHFIFVEGKIPGCVAVAEARREAERALAAQTSYLAAHGRLARLPTPLAALRHGPATERNAAQMIAARLSAAAWERVEPRLAGGLGVLVYAYPSAAPRAAELETALRGLDVARSAVALRRGLGDANRIAARWIVLFARMLTLGYAPGGLSSMRSGLCCQPQNACLDGGFVDLDSIERFAEMPDERAAHMAAQASLDALLESLSALAGDDHSTPQPGAGAARPDLHHIRAYALAQIRAELERETTAGRAPHLWIQRFFSPAENFAALTRRLTTIEGRTSRFGEPDAAAPSGLADAVAAAAAALAEPD